MSSCVSPSLLRALTVGAALVAVAGTHTFFTSPRPVVDAQVAAVETVAPLGIKGDKLAMSTHVAAVMSDASVAKEAVAGATTTPDMVELAALSDSTMLGTDTDTAEDGNRLAPVDATARRQIESAVAVFVWGMSNKQPEAVWNFALEEEQDWLGTADAAMEFFGRLHPALTSAKSFVFEAVNTHGDMPVASAYIRDGQGVQWRATFEMVRDEAGSWRIMNIQTDVAPGDLI